MEAIKPDMREVRMKKIRLIFTAILLTLCVFAFSQENSQSYHGMRMTSDQSTFEVVFISTENGTIQLGFSIPVNPSSIKAENIILNGTPLSKETPIKFNKTGKIVEITKTLPTGVESVLTLNEILSFDNQTLAITELDGLVPGELKNYSLK